MNKDEAIVKLKSLIKPQDCLIVNIASVSASGMTRKMDLFVVGEDQRLIRLNYFLKAAGIEKLDKNGKIIVRGCGMDMAFALTHSLKQVLFSQGEALKFQDYQLI